ncbi:MAG TPA: ABC transporter substrate-binding protein [Solirubrobacteraceae bacterium]|jgi:branched-chain amino acid transport system substrate-binding protein|nr:ABC transporter substrate-binding protein [Solirubrobacteraceae bacterium]
MSKHIPLRGRLTVVLAVTIGAVVAAVCSVGGGVASAHKVSARAASSTSSCGSKAGVKATGSPIPVGAIDTKVPGTDFSDIENMEGAYFACVNANGGVKGHPIKLFALTENLQAATVSADAKKLVQTDHVVAVSGSSSVIECSVDYKYWQTEGYKVIADGIAPECYSTPNYADANMGPRFSSDGAAQYVENLPGVNKIVFDQSNVPGTGYNEGGIPPVAKLKHLPVVALTEDVPINDADAVALKEVDDAGPNGAVVLNFTPPEALVILQAAQKLGLEDRVKAWACSTPCDTDFLSSSLGAKWNGHFFVNAELTPPDPTHTPTMNLYEGILKQYGKDVSGGIGSFSQMGFVDGEILVHALSTVKGSYTKAAVNKAIENVRNFNTGMLCEPWTYGPYKLHIANHTDYTVTPNNGKMVIKQGCTKISSADPLMEAYYKAIGR